MLLEVPIKAGLLSLAVVALAVALAASSASARLHDWVSVARSRHATIRVDTVTGLGMGYLECGRARRSRETSWSC